MGTRSYFVLVALAASAMIVTGCNSPRRGGGGGGGTDSGTPTGDGGTGGVDSGPVGVDSGPVGVDSGPVGVDSGPTPECSFSTDCPSGEECVSGMCQATTSCPTSSIPLITEQVCSDATRTCTEGCSDGTCIVDCLMADASPDCMTCANQNIVSCFNSNGCQEQWNCFNACIEDNCPSDASCADTTCSTENDAYNACTEGVPASAMCGSTWSYCVGL